MVEIMSKITYNEKDFHHGTCLADFCGNYTSSGFWADIWFAKEVDFEKYFSEVKSEYFSKHKKIMPYEIIEGIINDWIKKQIEDTDFVITLVGYEFYAKKEYFDDLIEILEKPNGKFYNDKELLNIFMNNDGDTEMIIQHLLKVSQ